MISSNTFTLVCAWCDVVIVQGPPQAETTHGMCNACFEKTTAELAVQRAGAA